MCSRGGSSDPPRGINFALSNTLTPILMFGEMLINMDNQDEQDT